MGTFVFKWEHPASEVYVTGTFDDWKKTEKLEKDGDVFQKDVTLARADEKIYYKFVVDGNWVTDHTAPQENDQSGNLNNVLTTDRIVKPAASAALMSGVTPASTSAELAKDVPLEKSKEPAAPGAFPETPAAAEEKSEFSVNPLPPADGAVNPIKLAPGEKVPDPSSFTNNTITSGVHDDPELVEKSKKEDEPDFKVSPLPAFPGAVNPVKVAPGAESVDAHVIQSAGPESTTAQLAAAVPLESAKVPEVVKESQEKAGVDPEASAVPEEVKEKAAVEKELESKVPEAPSTSEGVAGEGTTKSESSEVVAAVTGAVAAVGGAALVAASGAASKLPESVTSKLPESVQSAIANASSETKAPLAEDTPAVVKESIAKSGEAPEAAANEEAVLEKKEVEKELLAETKKETATGEKAPQITSEIPSAVTSGVASTTTAETTTPTKPDEGPASSAEKKKKKRNRLSAFFNKLKKA